MVTNELFYLLIVVGLVTGCVAGVPAPPCSEPPHIPLSLPTQPPVSETVPASETSATSTDRAMLSASPPAERMPLAFDDDDSPPTPVEVARANLARRLDVDLAQVEAVEVVPGDVAVEDLQCLADRLLAQRLLAQPGEVQWIHLSVKGNAHYYVALGQLVIYCPRDATDH
jgi:hypothetical protein